MTAVRAAMIKLLAVYRALDYALTQIKIQKLAYFLEEAGEPLKMKFEANIYGPYSNTLEHVLKALDGHYLIGVGDRTGPGEIQVALGAVEEANSYLSDVLQSETAQRVARVSTLISGYETPYGMELLGTVHWVATHEPRASNADEAVEAVHAWNPREKQQMSQEHIRLAWERLASQNWLS